MELRRLRPSDLGSYFENRLRALQNSPTAFLTTYEEEISRGAAHFENTLAHQGGDRAIFGAVLAGKVVGSVGIYRDARPKVSHKAIVWGMYVDPEHQGKGWAAKLLDLALTFAKEEMNVSTVNLSVESNNLAAKALYNSRGFETWGVEPRAMRSSKGIYFSEDHMSLKLRLNEGD